MADGFEVDFSELDRLTASFEKLGAAAPKRLRQAMEVTARNIKDEWADSLKGSRYLPYAHRAINYEFTGSQTQDRSALEAEIGADLGKRQGSLVGIVEYGSPTLSPRGYGHAALQANEEDFQKGLERALEDSEKDADL